MNGGVVHVAGRGDENPTALAGLEIERRIIPIPEVEGEVDRLPGIPALGIVSGEGVVRRQGAASTEARRTRAVAVVLITLSL